MEAAHKIIHILDRLTLGPRPGDRQSVERMGIETYIQSQLYPSSLPEPEPLAERLRGFSTLKLTPVDLFEHYTLRPEERTGTPEERRLLRQRQNQIKREAIQARLLRAIESPHQLKEVMVDFWFNHCNVFAEKGYTRLWIGAYERDAIRPYALGKFRDLLGATAKHPAMLFYLDNWLNTDPHSPGAHGRFQGFNENYARELLELHTLGDPGDYTQADVEMLTRILTGWSLVRRRQHSPDGSGFKFFSNRHDASNKVLLGEAISGGGMDEGEAALDLLAQHPATARHIGYKLAQYFVADTPPEHLINQLSQSFLATEGDIRAVLSTLFESSAFWQQSTYQRKFKTPYQYLLSMVRSMGITAPSEATLRRLTGALKQLGMPLYGCLSPDGYANVKAAWLSPDAMVRRVSLAIFTVNHPGNAKPAPADLLETLGHDRFSPETLAVIDGAPRSMRAALILGSSEMMYR